MTESLIKRTDLEERHQPDDVDAAVMHAFLEGIAAVIEENRHDVARNMEAATQEFASLAKNLSSENKAQALKVISLMQFQDRHSQTMEGILAVLDGLSGYVLAGYAGVGSEQAIDALLAPVKLHQVRDHILKQCINQKLTTHTLQPEDGLADEPELF